MIFAVNATALTPLSFRAGRNNTDTDTLDYVPGSALLGSLINAHQLMRDDPDELNTFFFQNSTRISNLYPASFSDEERLKEKLMPLQDRPEQDHTLPVYPLPTTARTCKRFPGFLFDSAPEGEQHGMFDHLLYWSVFALSENRNIELLEEHRVCPHSNGSDSRCKAEITQPQGFYRRGLEPDQWAMSRVKQMLRTYTGIDRKTGTVLEGILFSRSVLAEQTKFWGTIQVGNEIKDDFEAFVREAGEQGFVRVGSNRSRGMGKIDLTLKEFQSDTPEDLETRLGAFNSRITPFLEMQNIVPEYKLFIPLTLISDVILQDHLLRYNTCIPESYLAEEWGIEASLVYNNVRTCPIMGWNNLWNLPKPDEIAIAKGSVFLFGLRTDLDDTLINKLFNLQTDGIGSRRREGFGQLIVADSFHWEVENV